jgi:transcription antitermination factor NusG
MAGSESQVLLKFVRAGIDVCDAIYCPLVAPPPKVRYGKVVESKQPMFPGYIFVRADWCRGALGVVPQHVIDELRAREGRDGIIRLDPPRRRKYRAGQMVRATPRSLLSGLTGIVTGMSGEDRVKVLFDLLGRKTAVTLREAELV